MLNFSEILPFFALKVSKDGQILVVVNHAGNQSNLYTSDRVSPHQAEFSLSLENIMYYKVLYIMYCVYCMYYIMHFSLALPGGPPG